MEVLQSNTADNIYFWIEGMNRNCGHSAVLEDLRNFHSIRRFFVKVPHFSTCPEIWKQAFRSARRREMPEQVWQQQTASASEPETCLPELPFLL